MTRYFRHMVITFMLVSSGTHSGCGRGDQENQRHDVAEQPPLSRESGAIHQEGQIVAPSAPHARQAEVIQPKPAVEEKLDFDPKDCVATFRWLFARATDLRRQEIPARNAFNENALNDEEMKKFNSDLLALQDEVNRHKDEKVQWAARVRQIDPQGVWVKSHLVRTFDRSLFNLVGPAADEGTRRGIRMSLPDYVFDPSVVLDIYFRLPSYPELMHSSYGDTFLKVDSAISRDFAKRLKPGDDITIRGAVSEARLGIDPNAGVYRFAIFVMPQP
jgi:hypothetical protein